MEAKSLKNNKLRLFTLRLCAYYLTNCNYLNLCIFYKTVKFVSKIHSFTF
jgi:hypothetical protein